MQALVREPGLAQLLRGLAQTELALVLGQTLVREQAPQRRVAQSPRHNQEPP